jgi:hypothetical protein
MFISVLHQMISNRDFLTKTFIDQDNVGRSSSTVMAVGAWDHKRGSALHEDHGVWRVGVEGQPVSD